MSFEPASFIPQSTDKGARAGYSFNRNGPKGAGYYSHGAAEEEGGPAPVPGGGFTMRSPAQQNQGWLQRQQDDTY